MDINLMKVKDSRDEERLLGPLVLLDNSLLEKIEEYLTQKNIDITEDNLIENVGQLIFDGLKSNGIEISDENVNVYNTERIEKKSIDNHSSEYVM